MLIFPFTQGNWEHVQAVWDRWQSLNVGILAFLASCIALYTSHHYSNRQHDKEARQQGRNLLAARSFLSGDLSELCEYAKECVAPLSEAWQRVNDDPQPQLSKTVPASPNTHKETFRTCISLASEDIGIHLTNILTELQVQNSRLKTLEANFGNASYLYNRSDIKARFKDLAKLRWLIDCTFDYARQKTDAINIEQPKNWDLQYNQLGIAGTIISDLREDSTTFTGLNHITIAVSDLDISFDFYCQLLGFQSHVRWDTGAYLTLGDLWLCLSLDKTAPATDYTHIALDCAPENFRAIAIKLREAEVREWKQNTSEGDSLYFLDPDGHKLEIHCGDLQSRLDSLKEKPYKGLIWY